MLAQINPFIRKRRGVRRINTCKYSFILNEITKRNIKHKAIQQHLGISKSMLSRKLHGRSKVSVDEAIEIQKHFFPDVPIEILFSR